MRVVRDVFTLERVGKKWRVDRASTVRLCCVGERRKFEFGGTRATESDDHRHRRHVSRSLILENEVGPVFRDHREERPARGLGHANGGRVSPFQLIILEAGTK